MLQDMVMGVIFIISSLIIYFETYSIRGSEFEALGPAFFPRLLCFILTALSLILIVQAVLKTKVKFSPSDLCEKVKKLLVDYKKVIFELITTGIFIAILPYLG
ncbi:MAG: hypothetical protein QME46_09265, partial [Thermoanaerobacteraceae bacterium]|nr:hypothetical protein [Thermoanaerobacteraceae bacterium]